MPPLEESDPSSHGFMTISNYQLELELFSLMLREKKQVQICMPFYDQWQMLVYFPNSGYEAL